MVRDARGLLRGPPVARVDQWGTLGVFFGSSLAGVDPAITTWELVTNAADAIALEDAEELWSTTSAYSLVADAAYQATWLAGLGSRLATRPANFSAEMRAVSPTLELARAQLKAGEPARRTRSADNKGRVHNATALVMEADVALIDGLHT